MALSISCSGCDSVYPVGENLIGKTIRCKKCGEMIPVTAPSKSKPVIVVEDEEEESPRKPSRRREESEDEDEAPRKTSRRRDAVEEEDEAPKSRSKRRAEVDEDDDDRPRRGGRDSQPKKSKMPLILGGLLTLVLLGGGGGAAVYFSGDEDEGDDVGKPQVAQRNDDNSIPKPEAVPKNTTGKTTPTTPPVSPKTTPPTTTPPMTTTVPPSPEVKTTVEPSKPMPPESVPNNTVPTVGRGSGIPGTSTAGVSTTDYYNGNIPDLKMKLATQASVFIKTETDFGTATGSGWFSVDQGLVFTNAHVLDMKAPNSPEPKKLTFFLNAGTPDQRVIPHSKLKILAVDREIDLAVIQIIGEPDLPAPMKIKPSSELKLGQNVFTIGYPLGYTLSAVAGRSAKEPEVSARKTSFFGLASNEFGQVRRVKLESGANPGNSGGAVIDANGEVVGVVVEGTNGGSKSGNYITLCVPTEFVNGLIAGRVSTIDYGTPYRDKDKIRVPITAHVLNPLGKTIEVRARTWIGDIGGKYRASGGGFRPKGEPNDANEGDVELKYDPATKTAKGELVYPEAPVGRTYWVQPYYSNAFTSYAMPGIKVPMNGPPVDRVSANLVASPKQGSRRSVTMSNSSSLAENHEGEGESKSDRVLLKKTLKVDEQVIAADRNDPRQIARLQFKLDSFNLSIEALAGVIQDEVISKKEQEEINKLLKLATAYGLINRFGEMYAYSVTVAGINDPLINLIVNSLSRDALEAMQATSIPMPNRQVNPGETWESTKDVRFIVLSRPSAAGLTPSGGAQKPATREFKYRDVVTYTYIGQRERGGRKEAVITLTGKSIQAVGSKETATGSVKGLVWVEVDTGVVVEAEIEKEFDIDTSSGGAKKRLSGINTYKLTRGTAQ